MTVNNRGRKHFLGASYNNSYQNYTFKKYRGDAVPYDFILQPTYRCCTVLYSITEHMRFAAARPRFKPGTGDLEAGTLTSRSPHLPITVEHHTSLLDHHTSLLDHHTSLLEHHTSLLEHHTSLLDHHTSIFYTPQDK